MQERHPIILTAKLEPALSIETDEAWSATIVVGIQSWLGAGEQEIAVGGPYPTREQALEATTTLVAKRLAGEP